MTWDNKILDEDFLQHVIVDDYGAALEDHKDKIVSALQKAKAYDALMAANHEIVKRNIAITEIYQENTQLKEEIHKLQQLWHDECDENEHLKENLFDKDQIGQRLRSGAHKKIPEGKNGR